tara:strand:+ start:1351 stop:1668 length:318 start_codon:yes stop_codon:yes gene_type:complete
MPSSRIKEAIGRVLEDEGFIDSCVVSEVDSKKTLTINLRYYEEQPVISNLQRVSRPGKRVYRRRDEIPIINNGLGVLVVSTSRGIMTGRQAQAAGIGGELLCAVS